MTTEDSEAYLRLMPKATEPAHLKEEAMSELRVKYGLWLNLIQTTRPATSSRKSQLLLCGSRKSITIGDAEWGTNTENKLVTIESYTLDNCELCVTLRNQKGWKVYFRVSIGDIKLYAKSLRYLNSPL